MISSSRRKVTKRGEVNLRKKCTLEFKNILVSILGIVCFKMLKLNFSKIVLEMHVVISAFDFNVFEVVGFFNGMSKSLFFPVKCNFFC